MTIPVAASFAEDLPGIPRSVVTAEIGSVDDSFSSLPVYTANSCVEYPHRNGGGEGWVHFECDKPVCLRFRVPHMWVRTATFRPSLQEKIPVAIQEEYVELTLPGPRYGVLEINYGDECGNLPAYTVYVLADRPEDDAAVAGSADTLVLQPGLHTKADLLPEKAKALYFSAGLHQLEEDLLCLHSDTRYHLAKGAVLRAAVFGDEVDNVSITGHGVLDGSGIRRIPENSNWQEAKGIAGYVCIANSRNILIDGVTIYNPSFWNIVLAGVEDAVIRNHKAISWVINNDGVQPRTCNNLLVEDSFLKCNDDCIAIKTRRALGMHSKNLVFRNLVLWNDHGGNPLEIGHTSQSDVLEDVTFENIDIVHGDAAGHTLDICVIDHSLVRNVLFENIRVEGRRCPNDFGIKIGHNHYSTDEQRGEVVGVTYRNISFESERRSSHFYGAGHELRYQQTACLPVEFTGDPEEIARVRDVAFESVYYNCSAAGVGELVSSVEDLNLNQANTEHISVK